MNFMSTMDVDFADTINKHHLGSKQGSILSNLSQLDIVDENGCLSCSSTSASGTYQNGSEIGSDSLETFPWTLHSTTGGRSGSITSDSSTISKPILNKNKSNTSNYNPFSLYPHHRQPQSTQTKTPIQTEKQTHAKEKRMVQQKKEKPSQIDKIRMTRLELPMYSNSNSNPNSPNSPNSPMAPMICEDKVDCSLVLSALPKILEKFDILFPFYRLSDKDCKHLSYIIYDELNIIEKVFCDSVSRLLVVKIYYYGSEMARKFYFYNKQDSDKQVAEWKDIKMTEEYCLQQLGYQHKTAIDSDESHRRSFSQNLNAKIKMQMKSKAVTMGIRDMNTQHNKTLSCQI